MKATNRHAFPALHNAMWPGLVGKGSGAEPPIALDTMLDLTASAGVEGTRFDGVDLFLADPHVSIDADSYDIEQLANCIASRNLAVGSVVAPVWSATGGGSAIGSGDEPRRFLKQVEKACRIAARLRELGIRRSGIVRIDSAASPAEWATDPVANTKKLAATFREACQIAEAAGERLAAEGEICWGGLHSWRHTLELLEMVDRPAVLGFQADMAHTMLFVTGYNAPEDSLLPENFDWSRQDLFAEAYAKMARALRPWTIDFHVAQNDGTVKGSGSHDKTGHHCLPDDRAGKLDMERDSRVWMRDDKGWPTRQFTHICWDGCMFPNQTMLKPQTWNNILRTMIAVRNANGWDEEIAKAGASNER